MSLQYFPVLLFLLLSLGFAAAALGLNAVLGPKRRSDDPRIASDRWKPFECGHDPIQDNNRRRISVKFYLVAVLFVLFDIEVVLLYPWAVNGRELGMFGFVELIMFMVTLLVGLLFAWKKGALEWR